MKQTKKFGLEIDVQQAVTVERLTSTECTKGIDSVERLTSNTCTNCWETYDMGIKKYTKVVSVWRLML